MIQAGDGVGVQTSDGQHWMPFVVVAIDATGVRLRELNARPLHTTFIAAEFLGRVPIVPADQAEFTHSCATCSRFGIVRNGTRLLFTGPSIEEIATGHIDPYRLVPCPICEGAGRFDYNPFAPRPGCALPDALATLLDVWQ